MRLGHRVFQTGKLDPKITDSALKALKDFKSIADRHGCGCVHSVATAALREATDARSFLARCKKIGMPSKSYPKRRRPDSLASESSVVCGSTSLGSIPGHWRRQPRNGRRQFD